MSLALLNRGDFLFPRTEALIESVFAREYGATVKHLPDRILAIFDSNNSPLCAAGLRDGPSGLFSECYLDHPVEKVVEQTIGQKVRRDEFLELTALAAPRPGAMAALLQGFAMIGLKAGYRWGLFTATARLCRMSQRIGIDLIDLSEAHRDRVPDPDNWGSYYEQQPRVCVVNGRIAQDHLNSRLLNACTPHDVIATR